MKKTMTLTAALGCVLLSHSQKSDTEYADLLIASYYAHPDKYWGDFYGGTELDFPVPIQPEVVLGNNTTQFLSLPQGSYVILEFTDNQIVDYPNQDDIFVTEIGCRHEHAEVYISHDGKEFVKLGIVDDCKISSLDLATIDYKQTVKYVKVVGIDKKGQSPGFDLVNVKGLPKSNVDEYVEVDSMDTFFEEKKDSSDKFESLIHQKIILKNIHFKTNSDELESGPQADLDTLASKLLSHGKVKIKVTGHTDNVGDDDFNMDLSLRRAKSVKNYLVKKGVPEDHIVFEGKGEKEPIKPNENDKGREVNRRVEFEIMD
jgi:outer membrane protein OmpA-like peptidoglycan-associated protein